MTIHPSPEKILTLSQMSHKKASTIQALFLDRELSGDQSAALNMSENPKDLAVATGLEKVNSYPVPKKGSTKEYSNHGTVARISHASKVMLKILHARLQYYIIQELPDIQEMTLPGLHMNLG